MCVQASLQNAIVGQSRRLLQLMLLTSLLFTIVYFHLDFDSLVTFLWLKQGQRNIKAPFFKN